ncbi:MAG: pyridoxamine 5'-phosphate oxidase family protein [Candidatus Micrarchaeota archaeon]|nr:pyridoxamine 5'-phosphate oxidase family protein [Candidatus Micrarchaeota archaeon]MDE1824249.1 pyridoxamine 5'-phosphate oxidase family protein [Candidatus Micrarchaeota archaeon]MDE1849390.1 pyridoxamine 5'-phosphate oxidase family protein [Candidatus Micrarchaeota archaeon]
MEAPGNYKDKAKDIIGKNMYLVLATSGKDGKPWACPVFFAHDQDYNFYFMSATDSLHVKNINENDNVGIVIFDSNVPVGNSDEVQAAGHASVVEKDDIKRVIGIYSKKLYPKSPMPPTERYRPEDYTGASEFRFYKIKTEKVFTAGPDRRVEVDLKPGK